MYIPFRASLNTCRKAAVLGNKRNNAFSDSDKFSNVKLKPETYGLELTEYLASFKV